MAPLGRSFLKLWSASAISNLGDGVRIAALPLLAASWTEDPRVIGLVAAVSGLPWLLFSLVSGALVDRMDRRLVMIVVDVARAVLLASLAVVLLADGPRVPFLLALAFALGLGETFFDTAAPAMTPAIVPNDRLESANARLLAANTLANEFIGPPLGSSLFAIAVALPFAFDSATFAMAAAILLSLRGAFRARVDVELEARSLWGRDPGGAGVAATSPATPWRGDRDADLGRRRRGMVLGPGSLRAQRLAGERGDVWPVAGRGWRRRAPRVGAHFPPRRWRGRASALLGSLVAAAIAQMGLAFTSSAWTAAGLLALSSASFVVWNIVSLSMRQALVPDALFGRVSGAFRFAGVGGEVVGALLGGALATAFGVRAPLVVGAPVLLMLALLSARTFTRSAA